MSDQKVSVTDAFYKGKGWCAEDERKGKGDPGRLPREVAQAETGRLLQSQLMKTAGRRGLSTVLWFLLRLHAGLNNVFHLLSKIFFCLVWLVGYFQECIYLPINFISWTRVNCTFFPKFVYSGYVVSIM